MQPQISIIIVNWKVRPKLEKCLNSILADTREITKEIFVVDNDSRDGTPEMIMAEYPQVTMISLPHNHGFARANNLAMRQASGKYLFLLNPDTEVMPGFFQTIISYLDTHEEVVMVGPKILNFDGSLQPSVRRFPTLWSQVLILLKLINIWSNNKIFYKYLAKDFDYSYEQKVSQIMGAAMIWRKSLLDKIGFFDGNFFIWFEEVDYCRRVNKAGLTVKYLPTAEIIHHGGASFGKQKKFRNQLIFDWSLLYYFAKHHSVIATLIILLFIPVNIILTFFYIIWLNRNRDIDFI